MLKKAFRLDSFALKNPKLIQAEYFSFKFSGNKEEHSKFAFVVSKKTDSRASARNEMKRKVRKAVEELQGSIKNGYDFIFYPKNTALSVTSKEVTVELKRILEKESLLNV